jgi:hypothetical protein
VRKLGWISRSLCILPVERSHDMSLEGFVDTVHSVAQHNEGQLVGGRTQRWADVQQANLGSSLCQVHN